MDTVTSSGAASFQKAKARSLRLNSISERDVRRRSQAMMQALLTCLALRRPIRARLSLCKMSVVQKYLCRGGPQMAELYQTVAAAARGANCPVTLTR